MGREAQDDRVCVCLRVRACVRASPYTVILTITVITARLATAQVVTSVLDISSFTETFSHLLLNICIRSQLSSIDKALSNEWHFPDCIA